MIVWAKRIERKSIVSKLDRPEKICHNPFLSSRALRSIMAGDIRNDLISQDQSSHSSSPAMVNDATYERFYDPTKPKNAPSKIKGRVAAAEGDETTANILKIVKSVKLRDFKDVYKKPCARDSLLTGIGTGFVFGTLRAIRGDHLFIYWSPSHQCGLIELGPTFQSCSWAVGTFCFSSWAAFEYCNRKKALEMQRVKKAVEVINHKHNERRKRTEDASLARS